DILDGALVIRKEGKVRKLVESVEQVSFSGRRAVEQAQEVTYITERCVMELTRDGIAVTEIAPGVDLNRDVLAQANFPLRFSTAILSAAGSNSPQPPISALPRKQPGWVCLRPASAWCRAGQEHSGWCAASVHRWYGGWHCQVRSSARRRPSSWASSTKSCPR